MCFGRLLKKLKRWCRNHQTRKMTRPPHSQTGSPCSPKRSRLLRGLVWAAMKRVRKRPSLPQSLGFLSMSNTSCQPLQKALIFLGPLALYILCRYSGLCCISFRLWTSLLGLWEEFTADGVASAAWIYFLAVLTASGPRLRVGCFSFLACGWPSFPWPSIYTYLCPHFIFL